jgi:hypothetical protein
MADPSERDIPRFWREDPKGKKAEAEARKRQRGIFVRLALMLCLLGVILGMLNWVRPVARPRLLPLWVAAARARSIPPTPMAEPDLAALAHGEYFRLDADSAEPSQERSQLESSLAELKGMGRGAPVLVYLRASACLSPPGKETTAGPERRQLMLLPADADPGDPATWLPLRSVLEALSQSRLRRKLLILDLSGRSSDPRLDLLSLDVARRVEDELQAVPDPYRLVITSCSPGQVPHTSESLGRSVFGFFIEEGMRGWADLEGTRGPADGIVTVAELYAYVAPRVASWSRSHRAAPQRPVLKGSIEELDFPLVVLATGKPQPHLEVPEAPEYPRWLTEGWRLRDQWIADGSARVAPWGFRQMEALLLRAERDWRGGGAAERIENDLGNQLSQIESQWSELRKRPHPQPRTFGLEQTLGLKPDLALVEDLRKLVDSLPDEPADLKPDERLKARDVRVESVLTRRPIDDRKLAWAVFEQACADPSPTPETILFLEAILGKRRRLPRYLETQALDRAARRAEAVARRAGGEGPGPSGWSPTAIHSGLEVARLAGLAENRPVSLPWVRTALESAAQARHEAEILLWEPGFSDPSAAVASLETAIARYQGVGSVQEGVEAGWRLFDQAMTVIPAFQPLLETSPQMEGVWRASCQEARELFALLSVDPAVTKGSTAGPEIKALESLTAALRGHVGELTSFAAELRAQLVKQSTEGDADGSVCSGIDGLLRTPFFKADERMALWKAGLELGRKLNQATLEVTRQSRTDNSAPPGLSDEEPDSDPEAAAGSGGAAEEALRRARWSIDLLQLGGAGVTQLEGELQKASEAGTTRFPVELADRLYLMWSRELPALLQAKLKDDADLVGADRLSRILPPFDRFEQLADPRTNPTRRWRDRLFSKLWAWLADQYDYESRDLGGTPLLSDAALGCRGFAAPAERPFVSFEPPAQVPELNQDHPSAGLEVGYRVEPPRPSPVDIGPFAVDPTWLRVSVLPPLGERSRLPLRIDFRPVSGDPPTPVPLGFLVRASIEGRSFHTKLPLRVESPADRPWLILGPGLTPPEEPLRSLRIRPAKGLQLFSVFVTNPGRQPRKVRLIVQAGEVQLAGGTAELTVGPRSTERVNLGQQGGAPAPAPAPSPPAQGSGPASAAPGAPVLVEMDGPLTLRLLDADSGKTLEQASIEVALESPRDYVRLIDARFEPPSARNKGKNRLVATLRALGTVTGPPIRASLALPADRIPGLRATPEGNLRVVLDARTPQASLVAGNLQLDDITEENGLAFIDIDDYKRAFTLDTTFARRGDPTTPRVQLEPALRVLSPAAARSGEAYNVVVESDNAPPGSSLDLSLGRIGLSGFVAERPFPPRAPRDQHMGVGVARGSLAFEASLADWSIPVDTQGLSGRLAVRAVLRDRQGRELRTVLREIVLDESAPGEVRIVGLPSQVRRGTPLPVAAIGRPSESGIRDVQFFWGKPLPDKKVPPGVETVQAVPTDESRTTWTARVTAPEGGKGPTPLSVQFSNAAGLASFATASVEITETDPVPTGKLRIKVLENDRPQTGLDVAVVDSKGAVKAQGKTDGDGVYLTGQLEKGDYRVYSVKQATPSQGQKAVTVEPSTTKEVALDLFYRVAR